MAGAQQELEDALWSWVNSVLNAVPETVDIIWANFKGPRPAGTYIELDLTEQTSPGHPYRSKVDTTTNSSTIRWDEVVTVEINAYGTGGSEYLEQLIEATKKLSILETLAPYGLSFFSTGAMLDLSEVINQIPEPRWMVEFIFGYSRTVLDAVGWIEQINYSGTYLPPA